ncbi:MAG: hypothetical protein FWC89_10060 [Defluviitaleaceae bacterium]|nr:hypothetical protein [Defluviitaleaceae bacterium]
MKKIVIAIIVILVLLAGFWLSDVVEEWLSGGLWLLLIPIWIVYVVLEWIFSLKRAEKKFSKYENQLPVSINGKKDISLLLKIWGERIPFLNGQEYAVEKLIQTNEKLYFVKHVGDMKLGKIESTERDEKRGVIFVSSKRFVFEDQKNKEVFECDLKDICVFTSHMEKVSRKLHHVERISFSTLEAAFDFKIEFAGPIGDKMRDYFIQAIKNTGNTTVQIEPQELQKEGARL